MKKSKTDRLITNYIVKIVVSTIISVLGLTALFSEISLRLDLSAEQNNILSVIMFILSCVLTSVISTGGFKNNLFLLSIISMLPLIILSLINTVFNSNSLVIFLIKVTAAIAVGFIVSVARANASRRSTVKI